MPILGRSAGKCYTAAMSPENTALWYASLLKPWFAPPAWIFGPVWSALYVLILISFGFVFLRVLRKQWPWWVAAPFIVNLATNLAFSPIQFSLQNNLLALMDILVVLLSLLWMMAAVWKFARWVAWIQLPYLLWVSFATVLQASITWLNW